MRDPERVLKKILPDDIDTTALADTGESLEDLVGVLRCVISCRKVRHWLIANSGFDVWLKPDRFHALLDIPEINFSETTDRNLDVHQVSLKETRKPDDEVSLANLNSVLRELFQALSRINNKILEDKTDLKLLPDIRPDLIAQLAKWCSRLKDLNSGFLRALFSLGEIRRIESDFVESFPSGVGMHPLRKHLSQVEKEILVYNQSLGLITRWAKCEVDLFRVLRDKNLSLLIDNLGDMGTLTWNLVYDGMRLPRSLELIGIDFQNISTIFDESRLPLKSF